MTSGEKEFLSLLQSNNGEYNSSDKDLAAFLGISVYSLAKYKKRLKDRGYIKSQLKYVDGKIKSFYKLIKPYDPEEDVVNVIWD